MLSDKAIRRRMTVLRVQLRNGAGKEVAQEYYDLQRQLDANERKIPRRKNVPTTRTNERY